MEDKPRYCYLPDYKGGAPKTRYADANEAHNVRVATLASRPRMQIYRCRNCGYLHLGQGGLPPGEWEAEQQRRALLRVERQIIAHWKQYGPDKYGEMEVL